MPKYMDSDGLGHFMSILKNITGEPEAPYTEVEWVESNGTQYVYLDWKPPIATWGFEADFQNFNAVGTTAGAWRSDTNKNGCGGIFGTMNSVGANDIRFTTYNGGYLRIGGGNVTHGFRTDKTRQTIKLHGTTLTKSDGTTATVARASEASGKPYANMTLFCWYNGVRRSGTGNLSEPGSTRIYSLKFYDGDTLKVDLVGAIRKRDGMTGLYDKVKGHFYPAANLLYGAVVGDLGEPDSISAALAKSDPKVYISNLTNTRMWRATVPELDKLEDGQKLTVMYSTAVTASVQTTELAEWDDTGSSYNVYLKLTLSDGSETEWIPCYYSSGGRLTTHYPSQTPIMLTYRENVFYNATSTLAGSSVMRAWYADPNYVDGNTTYTKYTDADIAGKNGLKRYTLCMKDDEGNWTSITTTANNYAATGKVAYTGGLQLGNIVYHANGAEYAAGANGGVLWETYGGFDFRYSVNGVQNAAATELQLRKSVYLVGTLGSDGLFYLDTTKWWTQALPTTEDGKVYVLVGMAYSSYYAIFLAANNPAYKYQDGRIVEVFAGDATTVGGHTVQSDVPANAKFTDTTYSAGTGLSLSGTTFSNAGVTGVKGNAETAYRTGQVNLTAVNVGAVDKTGDTMTGTLTLAADRYTDDNATAALKLRNSNIIGVNSIYTADASDSAQEGIHFYRDSTHVDSIHANGGKLYFTPNRQLGTNGTPVEVLRSDSRVSESLLKWGGANFSASYGCIDAAMIPELGANRLALSKAAGISVEYSRDGGETWLDYGLTDQQKTALFGKGGAIYIGKWASSSDTVTANWKVRVTLTTNLSGTYTTLNKFAFYLATTGATGNNVTITARTKANLDAGNETWLTIADHVGVGGWSGWNIINYPAGITTYGNNSGQYANIRFEFGITGLSSSYSNALGIFRFMGFGGVGWSVPSYLAAHGHLYDYDSSQNAYFPGSILPTGNNVFNLGSSGSKWLYIYAAKVYGDVQGGIQPATIRPTSANTTGYGAYLRYFLATSSMTTGKPSSGDGHILDMEWDNSSKWHGQLAVPNLAAGHVEWRTENGGTWTSWHKLFDDKDTIPASNGGTGQTSLVNSANALINALTTGSSDPGDNDYYVSQYVGGGTATTTYHRRPMSALWNYVKSKISSVLGLTASQYGGNAATATSATTAANVTGTVAIANGGTGQTTAAEAWTALGGGAIGKKSTLAASDIPSLAISKITNLQTSLDNKAPLASPAFTGTPTAPTAATGTNTTQVATTAFVKDAMDNLTVYSEDIEYGTGTVAEALDEMSQTVHNLPTKTYSKVKVGTTTMEADSATGTLTLAAGTNVTLTPDAANDKVTIAVQNATGYSLDNDIIGRATDYGPLYFSEDAGDTVVVDGPLPVEYGGTGVATIAALKTALGLGDSGWLTLPLGSVFKSYSTSYTPMYRKVNGVVEVTGGISPNTAQTLGETALTIGTLPTGYRPASNRNVQVICQASGRKLWLLRIDSSGVVSAQRMRDMGSTSYQSMSTSEWMLFTATFLAG